MDAYVPQWRQRQLAHMATLHAAAHAPIELVLYGATALNVYVDPAFHFETHDLDFFCTADNQDAFNSALCVFVVTLQQSLTDVNEGSWDNRVSVRQSAYVHGKPTTAKVCIGNTHVADLTMHTASQRDAVQAKFPRETVSFKTSCFLEFDVRVASLNELLHRMASTINNTPCVDGIFIDALSPDTATHIMQQQRVLKDSKRLDRLMLIHGMNQNLLVWRRRQFVVHDSLIAAHDSPFTLRTPIAFDDAKLAFPDVPVIEASFTYMRQRDARKLRADCDDAHALIARLQADLRALRVKCAMTIQEAAQLAQQDMQRLVSKDAAQQRKLIVDYKNEVALNKQRLDVAKAKHADKMNEVLRKQADQEKHLKKKHAEELATLRAEVEFQKANARGLKEECRAKGRVIDDRSDVVTKYANYFRYLRQVTLENFELMINEQKKRIGARAYVCIAFCMACVYPRKHDARGCDFDHGGRECDAGLFA